MSFGSLNVPQNYITLTVITVLSLPLLFYKTKRASARTVFFLFSFISIVALVSGLVINFQTSSMESIIYTACLSWVLMFFAFSFSKIVDDGFVDGAAMLTRLSRLLTVVFVIYAAFFVFRGSGVVERLQGPLGVASVIHVPMLLALSVHVYNVMAKRSPKISLLFATATMGTLFLTNSRAGILSFVVLLFLVFIQKGAFKKKALIFTLVFVCALTLINLVDFERFTKLEDLQRQQTTAAALSLATDSTASVFLGSGFGNIWSLSAEEQQNGDILHHAHSVFLELFVELGLLGTIPFALIVLIVLIQFSKSVKQRHGLKACVLAGVLSTIFPSFFTDLYLFKNYELSLLWWFYLFAALTLPPGTIQRQNTPVTAAANQKAL